MGTPAAPSLSAQLTSARAARQLTRAQERRYERVLSRVKSEETRRAAAGQKVEAIELILAIFLPPIGVLVHEKGQLTSHFWISLLLTFLFFIPGMIYSILVVTDTI
ncbi:MAG: YqaE/Pmp3 family membrane protein [Hymenobacteraceae bacterium]|nr:YqaE/Pmp3 family membrane protein [Hymenobacteraceae bacterium]